MIAACSGGDLSVRLKRHSRFAFPAYECALIESGRTKINAVVLVFAQSQQCEVQNLFCEQPGFAGFQSNRLG